VHEEHKPSAAIDYLNITDPADDLYTEATRRAVTAFREAGVSCTTAVATADKRSQPWRRSCAKFAHQDMSSGTFLSVDDILSGSRLGLRQVANSETAKRR
jgi:hypothetical protein